MSDNSFAKARNIGTVSATSSIRAQGRISSSDPVDIFKYKTPAGSAFQTRASFSTRGGSLNFSVYYSDPITGRIQGIPVNPITLPANTQSSAIAEIPALPVSGTFYLKFDRPVGNVRYDVRYTSLFS